MPAVDGSVKCALPVIIPPASGKKVPVPGVLADTQSTPLPVEVKTSPADPVALLTSYKAPRNLVFTFTSKPCVGKLESAKPIPTLVAAVPKFILSDAPENSTLSTILKSDMVTAVGDGLMYMTPPAVELAFVVKSLFVVTNAPTRA